jgi:hypothetical protein
LGAKLVADEEPVFDLDDSDYLVLWVVQKLVLRSAEVLLWSGVRRLLLGKRVLVELLLHW